MLVFAKPMSDVRGGMSLEIFQVVTWTILLEKPLHNLQNNKLNNLLRYKEIYRHMHASHLMGVMRNALK